VIELKQVEFFKSAIESISSFIPEGNFRFTDKGIFFKAIDPSQVVLVDYFVDRKLFEKYEIEPNYVGVDLVELSRILQRTLIGDKMVLDVSDAEIKIRLDSELKRNFRLPLIDVSAEEPKAPDINYEAKVEINAASFKEIIKDASLFGSSVVLKVSGGKFFVEAKGAQGVMDAEASKATQVLSKTDITAKFSLNFLQNIIKQAANEKQVTIELKNDSAMRVSYNIGASRITFYLAHMIL
jgi:proliferating cell nuclear antigen